MLTDPLHIIMAADHPRASQPGFALTDLAAERWIQGVHHGSTINVLPQVCRAAGFEPDILFRTDDQVTVRGLVGAGIGIALAPFMTLSTLPAGVVARPLAEPSLVRTVMAVLPVGAQRLPAAEAMVEVLRHVSARF